MTLNASIRVARIRGYGSSTLSSCNSISPCLIQYVRYKVATNPANSSETQENESNGLLKNVVNAVIKKLMA